MKKTITILAASVITFGSFAQDITSKKGELFLPEAKDIGLSVEARPFLEYIGNFFGKNNFNNAPTFNFLGQGAGRQSITFKYFLDAKSAVRATIQIGVRNQKSNAIFQLTNINNPNQKDEYIDSRTISGNDVIIGAGYEMRRGKTRLQGYYGGDFYIGTGKSTTTYDYALKLSNTNTFHNNLFNAADDDVLKRESGRTIGAGLRGFIGAEYFIIPKLSIGGEFGWGLAFSRTGQGVTTNETLDVNNNPFTEKVNSGGNRFFGLDTDNQNPLGLGNFGLKMTMHF
jgi:hypothetical protein